MTLYNDIAASGTLIAIIIVYQYFMIIVIGPDTILYDKAAGTSMVNGTKHAQFWFEIAVLWAPLIGHVVALVFPFTRNYRQSLRSGVR